MLKSLKWEPHVAISSCTPPSCLTSVSAAKLASLSHASADTGTVRTLHHLGMWKV